jgi:hypothetical protein
MKWKLINSAGLKTYAVVFDDGDEVIGLLEILRGRRIYEQASSRA